MNWYGFSITLILLIIYIILFIKQTKRIRNSPPNGKTFIKKFYKIINDIYGAQDIDKCDYINAKIDDKFNFRVNIVRDNTLGPLENINIKVYESFSIYINDEIVCREHILNVLNGKAGIYFEFTRDRDQQEVVDIIKAAHISAIKIINEGIKKYINPSKNSFYSEK